MELPTRAAGDRVVRPGRYGELQHQVRRRVRGASIPVLFVYAFDFRTRLGPFLFLDKLLIPGAAQAVGAALHAAGLTKLRLVLQQWCPHVRPSQATFDGVPAEVLLVSSMQIHSFAAYELIRDAWTLGEHRPLILAGGPKAIYEPWDFFALSEDGRIGADVVVTGGEFVLLELLDRLLEHRAEGETLLQAFQRARREGLLEDIPGLVYRPVDEQAAPEWLVHTGGQRLVQNLDELPKPLEALGLFEPPHRRHRLTSRPIPLHRFRRHASVLAAVITHGCKFRCSYCPIPAYNQFTFRSKSPERVADDVAECVEHTGISQFFSTDDNFFNHRGTLEELFRVMARRRVAGRPFRDMVQIATEATEFDVYKNRDLLPLAREAGLRLIWFGIEDLTAELIKKGQSPEKTEALFRLLLEHDIGPMPMLMHHDGQPLWSRGSLYGLLNQVRHLRRCRALSLQVTFLTPAAGTKGYEDPYHQEMVIGRAGSQPVDDHLHDGNHCIATMDIRPWRKQLNLLAAYAAFYNPLALARALVRFDRMWYYRLFWQLLGNAGLVWTVGRQAGWLLRLVRGPITRLTEPPRPKLRMITPDNLPAKKKGTQVVARTP